MVLTPTKVLVTGANAGIGLAAACQFSLRETTEKVILGCRSEEKAKAAKAELEEKTGKSDVFDVLVVDVADLESIRNAVASLETCVDCVVLNAGGPGGKDSNGLTRDGFTNIMAVNTVGHALLVEELLDSGKLVEGGTVVYASSEAARGVPKFGFDKPIVESGTVEEFASAIDGSKFVGKDDSYEVTYSYAKLLGVLWTSSMARERQADNFRFVSVSPGATEGTNIAKDFPLKTKILYCALAPIMRFFGMSHDTDHGAKRYLDVVYETEKYDNGVFYGSVESKFTGDLVPQLDMFEALGNETYQDNAKVAIRKFLKK